MLSFLGTICVLVSDRRARSESLEAIEKSLSSDESSKCEQEIENSVKEKAKEEVAPYSLEQPITVQKDMTPRLRSDGGNDSLSFSYSLGYKILS